MSRFTRQERRLGHSTPWTWPLWATLRAEGVPQTPEGFIAIKGTLGDYREAFRKRTTRRKFVKSVSRVIRRLRRSLSEIDQNEEDGCVGTGGNGFCTACVVAREKARIEKGIE